MTGIIEKITTLLGIRRDGQNPLPRRKKDGMLRREKDTITISEEARRLSDSTPDEGAPDDGQKTGGTENGVYL